MKTKSLLRGIIFTYSLVLIFVLCLWALDPVFMKVTNDREIKFTEENVAKFVHYIIPGLILPDIKRFSRNTPPILENRDNDEGCASEWLEKLLDTVNTTNTNPELISAVVDKLHLDKLVRKNNVLGDMRKRPVDFKEFLTTVSECSDRGIIMGKITCDLLSRTDVHLNMGTTEEVREVIVELVHYMLVLDA
eukprot:UN30727